MARTDHRGAAVGLEIARETAQLAVIGAGKGLFAKEDIAWIFKTVAYHCTDPRDQWLYLATCNAHGLNPIKRELFAIPRDGKITFVTSYHVFVSRARRAGFVLVGDFVEEGDDFVMDAMTGAPVRHQFTPKKDRGRAAKILGAWASAKDASGRVVTGKFWPAHELLSTGPNPLRDKIPAHFCWKTAICRVGRLVAPDLASLYAAEEFGVAIPDADDRATVPELAALPAEAEGAVQAQTQEPEPEQTVAEKLAGAAEDAVPVDPPLTFPERAALQKELAMRGMTKSAQVMDAIAGALGERVDLRLVTRGQRDKVLASLPPLRAAQPKEK